MQYTGLKDSKRTKEYPEGQEIYEDDICIQKFDPFKTGEQQKGKAVIEVTRGLVIGGHPVWPHDIEIIGNIMQNPELLK